MTDATTLLRQALDALEHQANFVDGYYEPIPGIKETMSAIREYLAAQPAPVPLTSGEIYKLWAENTERSYCEQVQYFARLIERAHGIAALQGAK